MKQFLLLMGIMASTVGLWGQQETQYTQFMHYKLGLNPAYAGNSGSTELAGLVRNQWMGIEGSPQTQLLTFSMPLMNKRIGLGANVLRKTIGVTSEYTLEGAYAYRIPVPRGYLGLGLQGSVRMLRVDYSQLQGTQSIDQDGAVPVDMQSKLVPNFGAGLYYSGQNFYFGVSVPRLLNSNIDLADGDGTISRDVSHFYIMGGVELKAGEGMVLEPQFLLKLVSGAPLDLDINIMGHFESRFRTGLSYRLGGSAGNGFGESAALLVGADLTPQVQLGMAYDLTLSELRDFSSGSVEVMLRCLFHQKSSSGKDTETDSPRFF